MSVAQDWGSAAPHSHSLQALLNGLKCAHALAPDARLSRPSRRSAHDPHLLEALTELTVQARSKLLPCRYRTIDREFAFLLRYLTTVGSIGEAIRHIVDFGSTFWADVSEIWIEERDGRVAIRSRTPASDPTQLFLHELRKGAMCLGMLQWLSGDQLCRSTRSI